LNLEDLAYVSKDRAETSGLFELISARYERRSLLITANQPFGEWGTVPLQLVHQTVGARRVAQQMAALTTATRSGTEAA
jgi:DNA replication protein DnaC